MSELEVLTIKDKLRKRAEILARKSNEGRSQEADDVVAIIEISEHLFGIPVDGLREIVRLPQIAKLPDMPSWLPGIVQIRGEILSIADLSGWFALETDFSTRDFLAVVENEKGSIGFLADRVLGFREIYSEEIAEKFDESAKQREKPVSATTKDLVAILDINRILDDIKLIVDVDG